jgi:hypothetical protein
LNGQYCAFYNVWSERGFENCWNAEFANGFAVEIEDFGGCFAHDYPCGDSNETLTIFGGASGIRLGDLTG